MLNPVYFNYGIAIHGAYKVPLHPASHGCIRIDNSFSATFFQPRQHRRAGLRVGRHQGARGVRRPVRPVGLGRPELHDDDVDDHHDRAADDRRADDDPTGADADAAAGRHAVGDDHDDPLPPPVTRPPASPPPPAAAA